MSSTNPEPKPEPPRPAASRSEEEARKPDPWGVKRAENLLQSLQGILSARVVVSPIGEIIEVHVLASSGGAPKQVVRNVESALFLSRNSPNVDTPRSLDNRRLSGEKKLAARPSRGALVPCVSSTAWSTA